MLETEGEHRCIHVRSPDQTKKHICGSVIAHVDHVAQELTHRVRRARWGVGEITIAVVAVAVSYPNDGVKIKTPGFKLTKNLDHDRNFDGPCCRHRRCRTNAHAIPRREILDIDGHLPRSVCGKRINARVKECDRLRHGKGAQRSEEENSENGGDNSAQY